MQPVAYPLCTFYHIKSLFAIVTLPVLSQYARINWALCTIRLSCLCNNDMPPAALNAAGGMDSVVQRKNIAVILPQSAKSFLTPHLRKW